MSGHTPHGFPCTALGQQAESWAAHVAEPLDAEPSPLFPEVTVQLTGEDGNAFAILAAVEGALRRAGHADAVRPFHDEATSEDYDHLLATCLRFVDVS